MKDLLPNIKRYSGTASIFWLLYNRSSSVVEYLRGGCPTSLESIVIVMFIVMAGLLFGSMANRAIKAALNWTKLEGLTSTFMARAARISFYVIALVSALITLGFSTTRLIATAEATGFAIELV